MSLPPRSYRTRRVTALAAIAATLVITTAACGSTSSPSAGDKVAPATSTAKDGNAVVIDTFMFGPSLVKVHVGDTVTWTNKDSILHTVTSGQREYAAGNGGNVTATNKDGMFDMQLDGRGATATFTFTKAGSFHYFCDQHPGMEADVEVS